MFNFPADRNIIRWCDDGDAGDVGDVGDVGGDDGDDKEDDDDEGQACPSLGGASLGRLPGPTHPT